MRAKRKVFGGGRDVKAPDFQYLRPGTVDEALAFLADDEASALAGGQSLMPMMNFRIAGPEKLVDLNGLDALSGIETADGWLRIGAMTRYQALERSDDITRHAPLMARALPHVAHPAIRNRGTIGGSCALADPAAEMPAILMALEGEIEVQSQNGQRRVAASDFFLGLYETARQEDELVTAIHVPAAPDDQRIGFHEIVRRHGDYAMAGCAISASGDLADVRVALFGVSDRAVRASGAEGKLSAGDIDAAIAALDEIDFAGDIHAAASTKRHLAGVALKRAWAEVKG